ncbi:nucleotidyltransferase domain-containing protein [Candidatus Woesearchaeota archaeon]|nr:nucleotidyltransferase domain-containing protein [Candidatus Woesearchaeota archaeon]
MFVNLNTLAPFLEEPNRKFHLREYARVLKISPATAMKYAGTLARAGLIVKKKSKLYSVLEGNMDSTLFRQHKIFLTVKKVIESGLTDFLDKELAFPTIVMFGSCAKGEDVPRSDLDLLVLTNTKKNLELSSYEKKLGKHIQLFAMNDKEFKSITEKSPELANNILNGIKLNGFLKVF